MSSHQPQYQQGISEEIPPLTAEEQLEAKRKKDMVKAYISAGVILGILLVASGFIVAMRFFEEPEAEFAAPPPQRPRLEPRKLEMKVRVNQLSKRSARPKLAPRMMVNAPSDLALPEIKKNKENVKKKVKRNFSTMGLAGVGVGVGGGTGTGIGGGMGGMGLPPEIRDRCSPQARMRKLRANGGRVSSEKAVVSALDFLQSRQNSDGSWGHDKKVGITGLAVLAYLGHCETPDSPKYGQTVRKGIDYLVNAAGSGGGLIRSGGHGGYQHGICTYALGEAFILTGEETLEAPFTAGIQTIIEGQSPDGGWAYGYRGTSDTSVAGWAIQALKAAYLSGLEIEGIDTSLDKAVDFMKMMQLASGAIGYQTSKREAHPMTGAGLLSMMIWKNGSSPEAMRAAEQIVQKRIGSTKTGGKKKTMIADRMNVYQLYYETQAMFGLGGSDWRKYNKWYQTALSDHQEPNGHFKPMGGGNSHQGGGMDEDFTIYRVALATMALEVFYRYLPTVDI